MDLLTQIKQDKDDYQIVNIQNAVGFIVFSTEKYTEDEKKELFLKYKNEKCLQNFDILNEPNSRYLYVEEIKDDKIARNSILTYVMINPSYARGEASDKTMDKARKWATKIRKEDNTGYKYFAVINLFSYRHHKPSEMDKIINNKKQINTQYNQETNLEFIEKFISNNELAKDFIIAFGASNNYQTQKDELLKRLENKNLKTFYSCGKPYHISCRKKVYDDNGQLHLYPLNLI